MFVYMFSSIDVKWDYFDNILIYLYQSNFEFWYSLMLLKKFKLFIENDVNKLKTKILNHWRPCKSCEIKNKIQISCQSMFKVLIILNRKSLKNLKVIYFTVDH